MTIYWAGGEDVDFQNIGGAIVSTTATAFRSAYARCALAVATQFTNVTAPLTYWSSGVVFSLSNFWFSARCYDNSSAFSTPNGNNYLIRWCDVAGMPRLQVVGQYPVGGESLSLHSDSTCGFSLQTINAAGNTTTIATTLTGFASTYIAKLDFQINYSNTGAFTMYVDGIANLNFTGNLTTDGNTLLGGFALGCSAQLGGVTFVGFEASGYGYWSEMVVASSDTRSMSLQTIPPSGTGITSQWAGDPTGSTVSQVTLNDGSGITSNTASQIELFTQPGTISAPYIVGIVVSARAMTGATSPQHLNMLIHQNGSNYASPPLALSGYFNNYQYIWQNDPSTSQPFANISTMQIGIESAA